MKLSRTPIVLVWAIWLMILVLELATPPDVVLGILYIVPLFLGASQRTPAQAWRFLLICCVTTLLRRLIENLLLNAIHHSLRGQRVWLQLSHQPGSWQVDVRDGGAGFPPEEFNPRRRRWGSVVATAAAVPTAAAPPRWCNSPSAPGLKTAPH